MVLIQFIWATKNNFVDTLVAGKVGQSQHNDHLKCPDGNTTSYLNTGCKKIKSKECVTIIK